MELKEFAIAHGRVRQPLGYKVKWDTRLTPRVDYCYSAVYWLAWQHNFQSERNTAGSNYKGKVGTTAPSLRAGCGYKPSN